MRNRKPTSLIGIVLLLALLCGCSANPSSPASNGNLLPTDHNPSVKVVVTSDFGKVILLEKTVEIGENTTALDALRQVGEVETKYGGGFVRAINGISSEYEGVNRTRKDWLFYINGISANIGADDYILRDGDIEHWEFRDWSFRQFVPAIIGDFPEPFLHGYGGVAYPTIIAYQDDWEEDAKRIADRLSQLGVESTYTESINTLLVNEKESCNLILLGTIDCQPMEELNRIWDRLGFYVHFQDDSLKVFTLEGDLAAEYAAEAGFIQATQSPWNPKGIGVCQNVVWMVSGLDETGVKNAVDTLVNRHNDFEYACGIVIAGGEIIRVPQ